MASVVGSIFGRFRRNFEKVFVALEAADLIPPGDHGRSAELFSDLMLGNNPIMAYTNWSAVTPSEQDMEQRVELFIMGRFGSTVARRARTKKAKLPTVA